jgi:predicted DNA-binding protein
VKRTDPLTERFEVRMTPDMRQALEDDAERYGRTPTESLRFAIRYYLKREPSPESHT